MNILKRIWNVITGKPERKTEDLEWKNAEIVYDKALAAHFEHTVAVTAQGPKVLTTLESSFHTVSTTTTTTA